MSVRGMFGGTPLSISTYATWNPSDKGSAITLSGGNLVLSATGFGSVRSTLSTSAGKGYFEVTNTSVVANSFLVGVATNAASLTSYPGSDAFGWAYYSFDGHKYNVTETAYANSTPVGGTVGCYFDAAAGTVGFITSTGDKGLAFTGIVGPLYAILGNGSSGADGTKTTNFGASSFIYTPPSGYPSGFST